MAKKDKRFVKIHEEGGFTVAKTVWVDTETGVQYLYVGSGYGGGLTPLIDAEGKPLLYRRIPNSPEL